MSGWRVEPGTGGLIHLYHEADQAVLYHDDLDPGEAWDLGDDLIIAADRLIPWELVETGLTGAPWGDRVYVAVASNRLALVCEDHGTVEYEGMMVSLTQAMDGARGHWRQQHSAEVDVAEHAEGEDGQADAQPSVPEAEPDTEAVADAHGGGDQVQNDLDK